MGDIWRFLLQTLTASGAAALLLVLKALLRDKLSPRWQFAVWGVLAAVLLFPAGLGGRYVLFPWPALVEALRSACTGSFDTLPAVSAPVPLLPGDTGTIPGFLYLLYWCVGLVLFVQGIVDYGRLRIALRKASPAASQQVKAVAERYHIKDCPAVEIPGLSTAFVCGILKPVLVLPAGRPTDDKVTLHELLHLKYRDAVWGILIGILRCIHWCNPLLWYCANRARNDLESLCDQRVLERLEGEDRREYGRILLGMADEKYGCVPGTSSIANGGKNIGRRIEAIARFRLYPQGMGLVSWCVAILLLVPLIMGSKPQTVWEIQEPHLQLASARTTYCSTATGAFDAYAKSILTGKTNYRAMCAPLSEMNALADLEPGESWLGEDGQWLEIVNFYEPYRIWNYAQNENGYECLVAFTLRKAPEGCEWDGTVDRQWLLAQHVQAYREDGRWVAMPLGPLKPTQGDQRAGVDLGLPSWEYAGDCGDFRVELFYQKKAVQQRTGSTNWFGMQPAPSTVPEPDLRYEDLNPYTLTMVAAEYIGTPEDQDLYDTLGVAVQSLWDTDEDNTDWNWTTRGVYWDESPIYFYGESGDMWDPEALPDHLDAQFCINGGDPISVELLPAKEGSPYDF